MQDKGRTIQDQRKTEESVLKHFMYVGYNIHTKDYKYYVTLNSQDHIRFCLSALEELPKEVSKLNSGQPWLLFWITNSLYLLKNPVNYEVSLGIIEYLRQCMDQSGGFSGGPYQLPHLASNYAAMMTLVNLNLPEGYQLINVQKMKQFIISCRRQEEAGSYRMHDQGESDMRAIYCALSVASLLNILTEEITDSVAEYIGTCQTYEGGFAAEPLGEAHGGYTYCALASLCILGRWDTINLDRALEWIAHRQMRSEGGFNGRTNKLVDSCYSFWVGASFELIKQMKKLQASEVLYDPLAVQAYILIGCQARRGMIDKPGNFPDLYHTCYSLAGLSLAQHTSGTLNSVFKEEIFELAEVSALYNVSIRALSDARSYFRNKYE
jgi:protein farnesyltransferase subunit beta